MWERGQNPNLLRKLLAGFKTSNNVRSKENGKGSRTGTDNVPQDAAPDVTGA